MRKSGYTLLELLITSLLFVVVSTFVISIFVASNGLTTTNKQSQGAIAQAQQMMNSIESSFQRSRLDFTPTSTGAIQIKSDSNTPSNSKLAIQQWQVNDTGYRTNVAKIHLYCINYTNGRGQMHRFTVITSNNPPDISGIACNREAVKAGFAIVDDASVSDAVMSDTTTSIRRFVVQTENYASYTRSDGTDTPNPQALDVEIACAYMNTSTDLRVSESKPSNTLVVQRTISRFIYPSTSN